MLASSVIILCHQNHSGVGRAGFDGLEDLWKRPAKDKGYRFCKITFSTQPVLLRKR